MPTKHLAIVAGLALFANACGAPEPDTQITEARREPLRAFGNWAQIPNGLSFTAPVVIPSDSAGTMIAAVGTDNQVYTTSTQDPGGLGVTWRKLSSSFVNDGNGPLSWVAGAGLLGETGAMANAVVLAYNEWSTGNIYVRVQNQTGSVVFHDWDSIPGPNGGPAREISMAWLPGYSLSGSQRKLIMIAGTGSNPDGLVYISGNTLTGGVYNHANWSAFVPMSLPGGGVLPSGLLPANPTGMAVAWACPWTSTEYSLVVAALGINFNESLSYSAMYFTKYNAASGGWGPWTRAQNGRFLGHYGMIGLAAGCGEFTHEMTLVGQGTDNRVYVDARQVSGGPSSWTAVGSNAFFPSASTTWGLYGEVSAGSSQGQAWVTAIDGLSLYYNKASAP